MGIHYYIIIKEALHIQEKSPEINIQNNNFTNVLKLFTTHDRASNNFNQTKEIKENDNSFNIFDYSNPKHYGRSQSSL